MAFIAACSGETPVDRIVLSDTVLSMEVGDSVTVTATVEPDDADYDELTWTSANTSIATVNNGTITAVAAGQTSITVAAGGEYAYVAVTVSAPATDPDPDPDPEPDPVVAEEVQHDVADIEVAYGTSQADALAHLPGSVVVVDSEGESHTMSLTWSVSGYDALAAGDYTATGTFSLPANVEQGDISLEVSAVITVLADDTAYLEAIGSVSGVTVPLGSTWSYVADLLAGTVVLTDNFGETYEVDLEWHEGDYDGEESGSYTVVGTFVLPEGLHNDGHDLEVTATVTVDIERPAVSQYKVSLDGYALLLGEEEPMTLTISTDVLGVAGAGDVTLVVGRDTSKTRAGDVTFTYNGESFVNHGEVALNLGRSASHTLEMELDFTRLGEYELWFQIVDAYGEVLQEGDLMAAYELEVIERPATITSVFYDSNNDNYFVDGDQDLEDFTIEYMTLELLDGETVLAYSHIEALRDSRGRILTAADIEDLDTVFSPYDKDVWQVSNVLAVPTHAVLTYKVTGLAEQVITLDELDEELELVSVADALEEDGKVVVLDAVVAYVDDNVLIVQDADGLSMYVDGITETVKVGQRVIVRGTVDADNVELSGATKVYNLEGSHDVTVLTLDNVMDVVLDQWQLDEDDELEVNFNPKRYTLENVTFEYDGTNIVLVYYNAVTTLDDEDEEIEELHRYEIILSQAEILDFYDPEALFEALFSEEVSEDNVFEWITFTVENVIETISEVDEPDAKEVYDDFDVLKTYQVEAGLVDMDEFEDDEATIQHLMEEALLEQIEDFEEWLAENGTYTDESISTVNRTSYFTETITVAGVEYDIVWSSNNAAHLDLVFNEVNLPQLGSNNANVTLTASLLREDGTTLQLVSETITIKSLGTLATEAMREALAQAFDGNNDITVDEDGYITIDRNTLSIDGEVPLNNLYQLTVAGDSNYYITWTSTAAARIEIGEDTEGDFDGSLIFKAPLTIRDGQNTAVTLRGTVRYIEDEGTEDEEVKWTSAQTSIAYRMNSIHKGVTEEVADVIEEYFDNEPTNVHIDEDDRIIVTGDLFGFPTSINIDGVDYEIRWSTLSSTYFELYGDNFDYGNVNDLTVKLPNTGMPRVTMGATIVWHEDTETTRNVEQTRTDATIYVKSILEQAREQLNDNVFDEVDEDGYIDVESSLQLGTWDSELEAYVSNLTVQINGETYSVIWTNRTQAWQDEYYTLDAEDQNDYVIEPNGELNLPKEQNRNVTLRAQVVLLDDGEIDRTVGSFDTTITVKSQLNVIKEALEASFPEIDEDLGFIDIDENPTFSAPDFGSMLADFDTNSFTWTTSNRNIVTGGANLGYVAEATGTVTVTANFRDNDGAKYSLSFTLVFDEEEEEEDPELHKDYKDYKFDAITVYYGDTSLELPEKLTVVGTDGEEHEVTLTWPTLSTFITNTGKQTVNGTFEDPYGAEANNDGKVKVEVTVEYKFAVSVVPFDGFVYGLETMDEAALIAHVLDEVDYIIVTDNLDVEHNVDVTDLEFVYFVEEYDEEAGHYTLVLVIEKDALQADGVKHPQVEVEITVVVEAVEEDEDDEDDEDEIEVPEGSVVEFYGEQDVTDGDNYFYVIIDGQKIPVIGSAQQLFAKGVLNAGDTIEYLTTTDGDIYKVTFIGNDVVLNDVNIPGDVAIFRDIMIDGDLTISGNSTITMRNIHVLGDLSIEGSAAVTGKSVTVEGDTNINTTEDVDFNSTFNGNFEITSVGTATFTNVTFSKNVTVSVANVTITDTVIKGNFVAAQTVTFSGSVTVDGEIDAPNLVFVDADEDTENQVEEITSIEISGPATIELPTESEGDVEYDFTATVLNQFEREISSEGVTWSVTSTAGISVDSEGVLTINNEASTGPITLTAISVDNDEIYDTFDVEIELATSVVSSVVVMGQDSLAPSTEYAEATTAGALEYTLVAYDQYGTTMSAIDGSFISWSLINVDGTNTTGAAIAGSTTGTSITVDVETLTTTGAAFTVKAVYDDTEGVIEEDELDVEIVTAP